LNTKINVKQAYNIVLYEYKNKNYWRFWNRNLFNEMGVRKFNLQGFKLKIRANN